jgi:hypothetical protein
MRKEERGVLGTLVDVALAYVALGIHMARGWKETHWDGRSPWGPSAKVVKKEDETE